ncbi:major facilitator superfamily domain-containing protein 8 isoform X1 [Drosophila guanche]|uniref:Blast:Major facilitator superfamily domain-containing protein 8 n=1 Tax=Drosophila guanche TaxID=7266 RepID=A0A3B0JUY3_DROGU|nr:major facilitator superfamily domain-containing protein 8 isoform X1 [Drosophila guanche]XP_034122687.1 major facilitator superfamily domain-containing protein 8 isoform X1 [Drosophila guanche]XP_034122688.1 major facilitator superfamily domain-containing protein 8 isoform X1 [Drosophila guanche]SPP77519.1 blast:Major facilitator superfamily domain-containing protein 8 [Drosophila guanche]
MEWVRKMRTRMATKRLPEDVDDGLETLEEYKQRWRSVRIIYFTMFLMALGFSIIITGIWPYLVKLDPNAGKEFMGLIVAANPLGQMIFSPIFGWWGNKLGTIRLPLLISLALFTVASGMYSSLELGPPNVKYWMLASRFLIGVSSANIALCRSYLSAATRISERTHAVSMVSLAQVLGFIIGPTLQAAVTPLGPIGHVWLWGKMHVNMFTGSGWINVIMSMCNFMMFLPGVFEEHKIAAREVMVMQGGTSERDTWKGIKPSYLSAWTLIVAFFVLVFNFVLLETLGTSLTMDMWAWTHEQALWNMGIMMTTAAIVSLVTFVMIEPLCKLVAERYVLIWGGFSLMVLGRVLFLPWGPDPPKLALTYNASLNLSLDDPAYLGCPHTQEWCGDIPAVSLTQFIIGFALTSVGYPIGVTLIQTIFSKVLGPRPQGVWMGWMTGSGCLSRVLGPVFVGSIYTRLGTYWTFGVTSFMMLVAMIALQFGNRLLIPPTFDKPAPVELQELNKLNGAQIEDNSPDESLLTDKLTDPT